ncbi:hypothetical protein ABB37_05596 [Leptomonas pyrrhocoris]|uniref:Uncharacterized protein n=1 Tax=Leptomonas pyrrhocoris TaxID=157538 RepID=A0A0M9FZI1_LEPPY|nr:hypothetical protein ABB37_05596 [Leptomonas pyrrhocoris]KPA79066.1 hypothetical protein ABB37_05596 [Leptomonas pyrrhocoris]|eukprot:XP_015657505.1 hypothetical protein ABB37_05596 [Leptomonas pyrrhocoris]
MSTELECGSDTVGRYTCRYAPRPSVCCANGCCAMDPAGSGERKPMQLWVRIVIAFSVAVGMVLLFLLLKYRDRRSSRAYKRLLKHRRAQAAAEEQQLQGQQQPPQQTSPDADAEVHAPDAEHVPTESRRRK